MTLEWSEILNVLASGLDELIPGGEDSLLALLKQAKEENRRLRVKLGIDPTGSDLHLGHMVCIQKLKQFQDLGHTPILIIGGYTAQVGDPSGRNETRPPLSKEEVDKYAKTYLDQVSRILDLSKTEIVNNADWFENFSLSDIIKLASKVTVNQMIAKEAFGKRLKEGYPLYLHEAFYPLLQGFDSVYVKADIELGGTDQTFNLLMGRDLQKLHGQKPQLAITMPLLIGLDGKKKMSKTSQNYIAINDPPNEMFGKTMSIPDELIVDYFSLAAQATLDETRQIKEKLNNPKQYNPRDLKAELARRIVAIYYSEKEAKLAEESFVKQFAKKEIPDKLEELSLSKLSELADSEEIELATLVFKTGLCESKAEAKRLISGGGVKLDGIKMENPFMKIVINNGKSKILQAGKRKFVRLIK